MEKSPEEKLRDLEKEIHGMVEESAQCREGGDLVCLGSEICAVKKIAKEEKTVRKRNQKGFCDIFGCVFLQLR